MSDIVVRQSQAVATTNADTWRASTDAASMCKEIVIKRAIDLQGRKYVPVEGWQAIAIAHGCVASAENVRRVDGGVAADGVIRRMVDSHEIARAEGFVGEDETTWYGGKDKWGKIKPKRPDYAIRAMAQTRAISRACRSAFAHVIVLMDVGLETTPYEEMAPVYEDAAPTAATAARPVDHVTRYAAWCAKAAKPEHCIQMRQKFTADVAAAEKAGTPVSDEIQNRVFEMIEARQDELAAAFAPEQDEEHVPA